VGQENSREAGKLFEGTPALFLNYLAVKIITFTSFIKLSFNEAAEVAGVEIELLRSRL
jgi:hypothetical protein